MEATTPELGPIGFWSPKSSSFSGSDSIIVEEAARNFLSPRPSINKSRKANSFIQHDKVEASKLCHTVGLPHPHSPPVAQYSENESLCNLQHFGI